MICVRDSGFTESSAHSVEKTQAGKTGSKKNCESSRVVERMMKPSEGLLPLFPRKAVSFEHLPSFDEGSVESTSERGPVKRYYAPLRCGADVVCAERSMVLFNGSTNMGGLGDGNAYNVGIGGKRSC